MIELPYPHKALWPNGRAHWGDKARETAKHRDWAQKATLASRSMLPQFPARLTWIVHPKPKGPAPDRDNIVAAVKAYQDGICSALGVNDRDFGEPRILVAERVPHGRFVAVLAECEARSIGEILNPIEQVAEKAA